MPTEILQYPNGRLQVDGVPVAFHASHDRPPSIGKDGHIGDGNSGLRSDLIASRMVGREYLAERWIQTLRTIRRA